MKSVQYKQIEKQVAEIEDRFLATNDPHGKCVQITHEDGSIFFWQDAIIASVGYWLVVFTEHYGFHIFAHNEIVYTTYTRTYYQPEILYLKE